jgi:hypothetical protein
VLLCGVFFETVPTIYSSSRLPSSKVARPEIVLSAGGSCVSNALVQRFIWQLAVRL